MLEVPHSTPYLTSKDKELVADCFVKDYVGFDNEIDNQIKLKLSEYLSYSHLEITPSASLALLLIFKYLKIKKSDEVILPAINCWSVYNCITIERATPILCDVRSRDDFRLSYDTVVQRITKDTKVIIITHMYGVLVEESIIKKLKRNYPAISIIEDFSTSLFSKKDFKLGKYSDFAIGSFGSTKPLTGGIGGVLCSNQKIIDTHYDQYSPKVIAFNIKISRINQALLLSQLDSFETYQEKKKELLKFYSNYFPIFYSNKEDDLFRAITFTNPQTMIDFLLQKGIVLDIRESVQPNLVKELNIEVDSNAFLFQKYYSIPLNIKAYNIFKEKGFI
jgi:perosamine synthetase